MNTIESQLAALRPITHPALARRILDVASRRRQRRRDCFVGLGGLLTGIAATVLVVLFVHSNTETSVSSVSPPCSPWLVDSTTENTEIFTEDTEKIAVAETPKIFPIHSYTLEPDPLDLDVWIARYERLLRHRQVASRTVYIPPAMPPVLPDGMSPLEYRQTLLTELGG